MLQIGHKPEKWQWRHNLPTWRHLHFFWSCLFLLSGLVTAPNFMSISSIALELQQFSFIRDWPEIRKSEIFALRFAQYLGSGVTKLGILNLKRMSLIKCCWMLQECCERPIRVLLLFQKNFSVGSVFITQSVFQSWLVDHIWMLPLSQRMFWEGQVLMLLYLVVDHLYDASLVLEDISSWSRIPPVIKRFNFPSWYSSFGWSTKLSEKLSENFQKVQC